MDGLRAMWSPLLLSNIPAENVSPFKLYFKSLFSMFSITGHVVSVIV